jgi:hypothetical protein
MTNKQQQQQQQSKSLPFTIKSTLPTSILPTIVTNPTTSTTTNVDSRVGSAIVTISSGSNSVVKQQEFINRHPIFTTRASSPYVNFYESHPDTSSSLSSNTPPNRLANMYKSNLTNNYNSNTPLHHQNDGNNTHKKHVHFFESPYKFPPTTNNNINNIISNNSNKQQISLLKGIKVRTDMLFSTTASNDANQDMTKSSIMVAQAPQKTTNLKIEEIVRSDDDSENYYYSTVNSAFQVKSENSGIGTPDSFARMRMDENHARIGEIKSDHLNSTKKSILIKKKHRNPIVASIASSKSSQSSNKKVTFAT